MVVGITVLPVDIGGKLENKKGEYLHSDNKQYKNSFTYAISTR